MTIEYKDIKDFDQKKLQDLFLSVEWSSGHFPEKLVTAIKNSSVVYSAWDGERLVGLINALDDGIMNSYIHYLLIDPDYQKMGIGRELLRLIKEVYKDYLRVTLIAVNNEIEFYEHNGFTLSREKVPMFITSLWT